MSSVISVVFVSRNRKDLLSEAIKKVGLQSVPLDIIVMDDTSTDGTGDMIKNNFPHVRHFRPDVQKGLCFLRNEGVRQSKSDVVFIVDDDTMVEDPQAFEKILKDFENPNVGAVGLPFINVLQDNIVRLASLPNNEPTLYHSFIGAIFAVRKDIFLKINGFRSEYFFMGEEGDLCIRLMSAGYLVIAGSAKPSHHLQMKRKTSYSIPDVYGRRNDILFVYLNSPNINPLTFITIILKGILFGIKRGRPINMIKGSWKGLQLIRTDAIKKLRNPVSKEVYEQFMFLKKNEPVALSAFVAKYYGNDETKNPFKNKPNQ